MSSIKMLALALIIGGVLGLMYGSFSYTQDTHEAKVGSLELSFKDKETVNVPSWVSAGAIGIGGLLFLFGGRRPK